LGEGFRVRTFGDSVILRMCIGQKELKLQELKLRKP